MVDLTGEVQQPPQQIKEPPLEQSRIGSYITQRLGNEAVYLASNYARKLPVDQRNQYTDLLKNTASTLSKEMEIDDELFTETSYCEAFLAACDSWVVNEARKGMPEYEGEKQFLTQFVRVLAGNKSRLNVRKYAENPTQEKYYVDYPITDPTEVKQKFTERLAHKDEESTSKLKTLIAKWDGTSPVTPVRENFLITSPSQELPYEICVLNLSKELGEWDEGLNDYRSSEWEKITGPKVGAFTENDPETNIPTMFFSKSIIDQLTNPESPYLKESSTEIKHEYAHTQRNALRIGAHTDLGLFWDEQFIRSATNATGGHPDAAVIFYLMRTMLRDGKNQNAIMDIMLDVGKTNKGGEFYQFISDNLGLRSLLLTLAVQPRNYIDEYGIKTVPGVKIDQNTRADDLLLRILEEREQMYPGSRETLIKNLKRMPSEHARWLRIETLLEAKMNLPKDIMDEINAKKEQDDLAEDKSDK